ncbi:MAG: ribosomal RNA small subunit methyltransferase A [Candidatus Saganbacteria bacterium]|nr:ribosomal RNA small subunit methyltransferase A [Candidatus Saganbacteria bacterium]
MPDPRSLSQITKELLAAYNLYPKKRLGQNFLIDPQVLKRIVDAAGLSADDVVVEIGMGLGVVTEELAKKANKVISLEVDPDLILICKKILGSYQNVNIVRSSILEWQLPEGLESFKVVANLPYYITAPIIEKILDEWRGRVGKAVLTIQKEVAERLASDISSKSYGSFSVFVQNQAKVEIHSLISKFSFYPKPEVSSAIIILDPYSKPLYEIDYKVVREAFAQRRKMIRSTLSHYNLDWDKMGIEEKRRPEDLRLSEFEIICKEIVSGKNTP